MNKRLIKLIAAVIILIITLFIIKKKNMTWRQSILKTFYPVLMTFNKIFVSDKDMLSNQQMVQPNQSIYSLRFETIAGNTIELSQYQGKKLLIVNTASDCGYTQQLDELEKLQQQYSDKLVIIGFPANDFKQQEKLSNEAIAEFCKANFGVSFILSRKCGVIKNQHQHPIFEWLSHSNKNGWCNQAPVWNFSKYLIDENGRLLHFFSNKISPLDSKVIDAIQN